MLAIIQPVVVGLLGTGLPLVDRPTSAGCRNAEFGREMVGEEPVRVGMFAVGCEAVWSINCAPCKGVDFQWV